MERGLTSLDLAVAERETRGQKLLTGMKMANQLFLCYCWVELLNHALGLFIPRVIFGYFLQ